MAKWDLSKLPDGRKPLPDEWFRERAQMQERIEEMEAENKTLRSIVDHVMADTGDDPEIMAASRAEWAARALEAEAKLAKVELHWQSSQRIGEAMYRLHKLKYWLDMDQELFDVMTDQQQADHKYVQTAVDGIIWALKGEK